MTPHNPRANPSLYLIPDSDPKKEAEREHSPSGTHIHNMKPRKLETSQTDRRIATD